MHIISPRKVFVSKADVASFNRQWPCSSLRSTRAYWFEFGEDGDLIDTDVPQQDDGPSADAVMCDCREYLFRNIEPDWAVTTGPETPVLFRKMPGKQFADDGVIAVFPTLLGTYDPWTMTSYVHVGQHGSCDSGWYQRTRAATPEEYASLAKELESIGYRLKVYKRKARWMDDARREQARSLRNRPEPSPRVPQTYEGSGQ